VHLVLPRRELFSREKQEPSASIALRLRGGDQLTPSQVRAIQSLVAAAVPGLAPSRVSVVDHNGNLLARSSGDAKESESLAGRSDELRRAYEQRLSHSIEELVGRTVGHGKVRAEVSVEMDFDRISTTSETFDPDGQVVRSTQNTQELNDTKDAGNQGGAVSVGENLPNQETQGQQTGSSKSSSTANRAEEVVNYEISKTVKNHVREAGSVRRLSVAVLVDGKHAAGANGAKTYQPLDAQTIEQIQTLVRSAIGFDAKRGDTIEVVNMRFAEPDLPPESESSFLAGLDMASYLRLAETLAMLVVGVLVLLLVVRPALRKTFAGLVPAGMPAAALATPMGIAITDQSGAAQLTAQGQPALPGAISATALGPAQTPMLASLAAPNLSDTSDFAMAEGDELLNIQSIEGRVKASSVKKIGEIVDKHPAETAAILRNWLVEQN
jgi:flagellar M-ring protein FliF